MCRINMLLQHYHTSTALSKKLDASFRYLQLQLGTPHNPLTLPFNKWGHLTPLLRVKMLWQLLDRFKIQLHMKYPTILFPRERDQVIMEIALDRVSSVTEIKSINRCQGMLQCILLSDVVTADGRYLKSFIFDPGLFKGGQTTASLVNIHLRKIGKHGSIFGTATSSWEISWQSCLVNG